MNCRALIPLLCVGLIGMACDFWSANPLPVSTDPGDSNLMPADTADTVEGCDEAEKIAMHLSGELTAPWQLRERVRAELNYIRTTWQDTAPATAIGFNPAWPFSSIAVGVTSETLEAILDSSYTDWDDLNEICLLESIDFYRCLPSGCYVTLYFEGCQNSTVLADRYGSLPGFLYSHTRMWAGDWSSLLPLQVGDDIIYFFREAWGDCPAGCLHSAFDVFLSGKDGIEFLGHYGHDETMPEPLAGWLRAAHERFWDYDPE